MLMEFDIEANILIKNSEHIASKSSLHPRNPKAKTYWKW